MTYVFLIASYLIVVLGQPVFSLLLSPLASCLGYALCWYGVRKLSPLKQGVVAGLWFFAVQLSLLAWMASIEFQGMYIIFVYGLLSVCLGVQFGIFSWGLSYCQKLTWVSCLFFAGIWTLLEWSRLLVLCGFSWNPVGMALTGYLPTLQLASWGGVYFLSWLVILMNLLMLRWWKAPSAKLRNEALGAYGLIWTFGLLCLLYPYSEEKEGDLTVGLIQTGLTPSQKAILPGKEKGFVDPMQQWKMVCSYLQESEVKNWDLLAFPEAAFPRQAFESGYLYEQVMETLVSCFGKEILQKMPPLQAPFAQQRKYSRHWYVSNAFWAQTLSSFFNTEVIIGLDHTDFLMGKNYNAAFWFVPDKLQPLRYDKRVLMPLAEYLPFSWVSRWVKYYGISEFFTHGKQALVFGRKIPISVSICYEETFPSLVREGRLKGAHLFVNVTNDGYYPKTLLPEYHYYLGRLRAVENGVPVVRACNTGVTGVIDSQGREVARLNQERGVLTYQLNVAHHKTLYMQVGDWGVLLLCGIGVLLEMIVGGFCKNLFYMWLNIAIITF